MFEIKESYKHLYAKKVFVNWCREVEQKTEYCSVAQFSWRANYGVFEELLFYETSDPYYFECSGGLISCGSLPWDRPEDAKPEKCFDSKYDRGKILFVPDITIFHKGTAIYLFEVVHSNPVSCKKIKTIESFFDGYHVELYEIEAEDILKQIKTPKILRCSQLI